MTLRSANAPKRNHTRVVAAAVALGLLVVGPLGGVDLTARARAEDPKLVRPLASYMGDMQRYSQKLGYAIDGRNVDLARFYSEKIEENVHFIKQEVPNYQGIPIVSLIQMLDGPVRRVKKGLKAKDWAKVENGYETLINVCNACHAAARRPFVRILPAKGLAPFNQEFSAGG